MNHIETIRNLLAAGERTRSEIVMAIGGDRAKIDNALSDLMSRGDVEVGTGDYGMRVYRLTDKQALAPVLQAQAAIKNIVETE